MSEPTLTTVIRSSGATAALKTGSVAMPGVGLRFHEEAVLVHAFRRMVRELAYDVCEMAFTTYLCARAHGVPFTALPVFLARGFHHGAVVVRRDGPVTDAQDLMGRAVGVGRGWTVTTGVWARGILADEHGVDLDAVRWVRGGDEHVAAYVPPANVGTVAAGEDVGRLLLEGRLAAAVNVRVDHPDVVPLIPDPEAAARRALRDRGLWPINHLVVVRDDVLETHPELAEALFATFATAKHLYLERLLGGTITDPSDTDRVLGVVAEITGGDPLPYGVEPNRGMIEQLVDHAVRQRIIPSPPHPVDDLFAPATRGLVG